MSAAIRPKPLGTPATRAPASPRELESACDGQTNRRHSVREKIEPTHDPLLNDAHHSRHGLQVRGDATFVIARSVA